MKDFLKNKKFYKAFIAFILSLTMVVPAFSAIAAQSYITYGFDSLKNVGSTDSVEHTQSSSAGKVLINFSPSAGFYVLEISDNSSSKDTSRVSTTIVCSHPNNNTTSHYASGAVGKSLKTWIYTTGGNQTITVEFVAGTSRTYTIKMYGHGTATNPHTYDKGLVTKEATCTETGVLTKKCTLCEAEKYEMIEKTEHVWSEGYVVNKPTCGVVGTMGYNCLVCGVYGTSEISATGKHTYKRELHKATLDQNGELCDVCTICGYKKVITTYYEPATLDCVSTVEYTGSAICPKVVLKDSKKKVIPTSEYTLKYKNNKKIGVATIMVVFKNHYSGTFTYKFYITPKKTSITVLKVSGKSVLVKWKKQSTISGYEIQTSTNSKFKNPAIFYASKSATSLTIKDLKTKKKYYFRIRTYKKVNGGYIYSEWSNVKTATTKK